MEKVTWSFRPIKFARVFGQLTSIETEIIALAIGVISCQVMNGRTLIQTLITPQTSWMTN